MKNTMKIFTVVCALALLAASCGSKKSQDGRLSTDLIDNEHPPVLTFQDTIYDFGTISQGESVKFSFFFTNTGETDLILQDVKPTCGCTVPKDWPKQPIKPGEKGKIDVVFDSSNKSGKITRAINVFANTKPRATVIRLTGTINAPNTGGI